jgi:hypothetical protein
MDTAVALVEAYLRVNGYFTVTEYPVLEASATLDDARAVSDLDVLAFRFSGAGQSFTLRKHTALVGDLHGRIDPALGCPPDQADMIVGEVKRGRARFNAATRQPEVLAFALRRFGCCAREAALPVARQLLTHGTASTPHGHIVRMVAFGGRAMEPPAPGWHVVSLASMTTFLQEHLEAHWDVLRHVHFSSEVLDVLALLQRAKIVPDSLNAAPT